jgi:peptidoglycan/LPS O-acetylase OafA/YrhL
MTTDTVPPTPKRARSQHWVALDGMRAFAVIAVMIYHWDNPHLLSGGLFGVDVFFVLSGFLITTLLLGENEQSGAISLTYFYARRALRLLPALFAVIIVTVLAATLISGLSSVRHDTLTGVPWVVFYVANWARAIYPSGNTLGLLAHTWSLAVEEQFYLIWPLVLVGLVLRARSRQVAALTLAGVVVVEWVYRAALLGAGVGLPRVENGLDTHSDGLLIGCAIALWMASPVMASRPARIRLSHVSAALGVAIIVSAVVLGKETPVRVAVGYTIVPVATALVLWNQLRTPWPVLRAVLTWKPLVWIGQRSYGLYLWHFPIYGIVGTISFSGTHARAEQEILEFVASFVVAAISYRIIELPALRLKSRFQRPTSIPSAIGSSVASTSP